TVFGKLSFFNGFPTITHPELEKVQVGANEKTETMLPTYSVTEKLRAKGITNRNFAKITQALFSKIQPYDVYETLPQSLLQQYGLMGRFEALRQIHFPVNAEALSRARHRLKWEELFIAQLKISQSNLRNKSQAG